MNRISKINAAFSKPFIFPEERRKVIKKMAFAFLFLCLISCLNKMILADGLSSEKGSGQEKPAVGNNFTAFGEKSMRNFGAKDEQIHAKSIQIPSQWEEGIHLRKKRFIDLLILGGLAFGAHKHVNKYQKYKRLCMQFNI